ncbi:Ig-like domain-containing protein [Xanthomonadaceae bacterium JHOS43]|nr:Ig-like domain-containing protein [Xanthomonadaceae bacterium JHOS43]
MNARWITALGLMLGVTTLPAMAQTAPADRLCTAGFNVDYGWFDVTSIDRLGVLEFPGQLTQAGCVPVTPAKLAVQLGGTTLPLSGEATYNNLGTTTPTLTVPLLEPALCEDYYSGAGTATWSLVIKDANDQDMIGPVVGITALDYNLNSGALVPQRADASTPWLACYAGLAPNAASGGVEPDEDALFADGLESESNLRVTFLDAQGVPLTSDVLNQAQADGSDVEFKVRVENTGTTPAYDVRIREFVPTVGALMGPTVRRVECTTDQGLPCSTGRGDTLDCGNSPVSDRFAENVGDLLPNTHREYTLVRRSCSSDVGANQSLALIQLAAFSAPDVSVEVDHADNSRSLRIKVVENFSPTADGKSVTTLEDTPIGIVLTGSDPEGDPLTFQVANGPSHGSLSGVAPNLTYTPAADYFGSDSFTYTANDGTTSSAPATVSITVTAVDDGPRVKDLLPPVEYYEGDDNIVIDLSNAFEDIEGDAFTLSRSGDALPDGLFFSAAAKMILSTGPLSNASAGTYSITVTATNSGTPPTASQTFIITVHNVNQDPVVSSTPLEDRIDGEGNTITGFSVATAFEDSDPGDELIFSVPPGTLPPGVVLEPNTGLISGTLSQTAAVGSPYTITITADDQQGGTISDSFVWTVNAENVAPVATGVLGNDVAFVGTVVTVYTEAELLAVFTDEDEDALEITVSGLPDGVDYEAGVRIHGAPEVGTEALYTITVRATDPFGLFDETTFHLGVY